mmetsp:Transcript_123426/g.356823  ORF Transcript_123426/g.356823 Transcript_123426/m.356823 type:complete len:254 (-) Transcript_123426:709-1470(-)
MCSTRNCSAASVRHWLTPTKSLGSTVAPPLATPARKASAARKPMRAGRKQAATSIDLGATSAQTSTITPIAASCGFCGIKSSTYAAISSESHGSIAKASSADNDGRSTSRRSTTSHLGVPPCCACKATLSASKCKLAGMGPAKVKRCTTRPSTFANWISAAFAVAQTSTTSPRSETCSCAAAVASSSATMSEALPRRTVRKARSAKATASSKTSSEEPVLTRSAVMPSTSKETSASPICSSTSRAERTTCPTT